MRSTVLALAVVSVLASPSVAAPTEPRVLAGADLRSATKQVAFGRDGAVWIEREVLRGRAEPTAGRPEGPAELWLTLRYDDGAQERFTVHGKNRLYDEARGLTYRFYMAYSLTETLAASGTLAKGPPPAAAAAVTPEKAAVAPAPEVPVEASLVGTGVDVTVSLDADERLELALELRRAGSFGAQGGRVVGAPDLALHVRYADGREVRYTLHGRAVLRDQTADRTFQFYMGIHLIERLAAEARGR